MLVYIHMKNLRILFFILLSLSLSISAANPKKRAFTAYKNVAAKKLLLLPFTSGSVAKPVRIMLETNLNEELKKHFIFDPFSPSTDGNDVAAALSAALPLDKQGKMYQCPFVLKPTIELMLGKYIVKVALFDVERKEILEKFDTECACPFEEILFWMIPEIAEKMSNARLDMPTNCPENMILIKASQYTSGSSNSNDNNPKHNVDINNFCIDRYEFPNKAGAVPTANLPWQKAADLCTKEKKRLCSENEWERACRSQYNYTYTYGNQYNSKACNTHRGSSLGSGSKIKCTSPEGVFDMTGNLSEWTSSRWDANLGNRVVRGGSFISKEDYSTCTFRGSNDPKIQAKTIGFRCCKSIK